MSDTLVRAYRQFSWDIGSGGWLRGYYNAVWLTSELHAVCMTDDVYGEQPHTREEGEAQAKRHIKKGDCNCGVFGTWAPPFQSDDAVIAICIYGGIAEQGNEGLRAEYARVEEIWASRELAAEIQEKYPDVKVHAGDMKDPVTFKRTGGKFKVTKTFARDKQPVTPTYTPPAPLTQAMVNGQRKRELTMRPRRMLTKQYRCLQILNLVAHPLDKPTIAILIGQKELPSHRRYFTGMSKFMTGLVEQKVVKQAGGVKTANGGPLWEITFKGRMWLKKVESEQEERYLSVHLQGCKCGKHQTYATRARTKRTGKLMSKWERYAKAHNLDV